MCCKREERAFSRPWRSFSLSNLAATLNVGSGVCSSSTDITCDPRTSARLKSRLDSRAPMRAAKPPRSRMPGRHVEAHGGTSGGGRGVALFALSSAVDAPPREAAVAKRMGGGGRAEGCTPVTSLLLAAAASRREEREKEREREDG